MSIRTISDKSVMNFQRTHQMTVKKANTQRKHNAKNVCQHINKSPDDQCHICKCCGEDTINNKSKCKVFHVPCIMNMSILVMINGKQRKMYSKLINNPQLLKSCGIN